MTTIAEEPTAEHEPPLPGARAATVIKASTYLHLERDEEGAWVPSEAAAQCPRRGERVDGGWVGTGDCADPDHYHAWLRLLNQFQRNEAREAALAARATRQMLLEKPGTRANTILESRLAETRAAVAAGGEKILQDELVAVHKFVDDVDAYHEVNADPKWEHINQQRERLEVLEREAEDNPEVPPSDELVLLRELVTEYHDAIIAQQQKFREPRYAELDGVSVDELMQRVREVRVESEALAEFIHVESWYKWFLGAHTTARNARGQHRTRMYPTEESLREEDSDIITALQHAFNELEEPVRVRVEGNS